MKNFVNGDVIIKLSDPWELGEQLGWSELRAVVLKVKESGGLPTKLIVRLATPFEYKDHRFEYFVVSPRHVGIDFSELTIGQSVFSAFTRIPTNQLTSDEPFDLSHLRSFQGIIGDIELEMD